MAADSEILKEAKRFPLASKKNTLFDAVIVAIARHLKADAIFSFDGWYRKLGMTMTDDFIAESQEAA